jgi:potassium/sodium efflux P-type ATPase
MTTGTALEPYGRAGAFSAPTTSEELTRIVRLTPEDALRALQTTRLGLSAKEAEYRRNKVGRNALPKPRGPHLARELGAELVHFLALLLWGAAALAFASGSAPLGAAIILVILLNAAFSFFQEYRAERATQALFSLLPQLAQVVRGDQRVTIPAEELVPGDVLVLREGNRISSDARVVSAENLRVDNSILTGESAPALRDSAATTTDDLMEARNVVFAGTFVTSGFGLAVAVTIGRDTQFARLSQMMSAVVRRRTPLQIDLHRTVQVIAGCAVGTGFAFFGLALLMGSPLRFGLVFSVGVIVALVPEGLLPTVTLALAMGAKRMAHRRALVRHLEAVETLGSTTVICSDKTGTMTANQLTVQAVVVAGRRFSVTGEGFNPRGALLNDGRPVSTEELALLEPLLEVAALCGNATLQQKDGRWSSVGDPVDGALAAFARKGGTEIEAAERAEPRVYEFAFEATRRRMSTVHRVSTGHLEVLTKGSPEAVLAVCDRVRESEATLPLDEQRRADVLASIDTLAREGLRVLALARRSSLVEIRDAATAEANLELLGLVGLADPVHPEVPEAVAHCRSAGIRVLMVTGDHPATARTVADLVGLPAGDPVVGADLPADDRALQALLFGPVSVLARINPEQKLRIARALQAGGEVVAMTGDGVNDAPALRQADIGIAMGMNGTDVAREAADIVLLDDNFASIVDAVREGRAVFENIGRFLTYDLTLNLAELAPFLAWALSAGTIPLSLSVLQLLALDLGASLLPALALGAEPAEPETMAHPPRARSTRTLDRHVFARAFGFLGPVQAALSLALLPVGAALLFGWYPGRSLPSAAPALPLLSTLVFASIVLMQMVNAFECRSTRRSVFSLRMFSNHLLPASVLFALILLVAFVYLPGLREVLGQAPLGPRQWLLVGVAPVLFLAAEELRKAAVRRLNRPPPVEKRGAAPAAVATLRPLDARR